MRSVALVLFPALLMAQSGRTQAVPRMGGKPDLTGVWQGGSTIPGSWEEANRGFGVGGSGRDASAPALPSSNDRVGGGPPYNAEAAKKVMESYKMRGIDDPTARCLPPGIPRANTLGLFPIQIVQTPKTVALLFEQSTWFHSVPVDGRGHRKQDPTWFGDSVGRWEGDTLVIDSVNFNGYTRMDTVGHPHSDQLHLIQRFTRTDRGHMRYEVIVDDPKTYTKTWKNTRTFILRPDWELIEYSCEENNRDFTEGHIK